MTSSYRPGVEIFDWLTASLQIPYSPENPIRGTVCPARISVDAVYRCLQIVLKTMWFLEGAAVRYILSAGLRISVKICSVLSMKKKVLMLMKNNVHWKTTKWVSNPTKNSSVLVCFDMTQLDPAT